MKQCIHPCVPPTIQKLAKLEQEEEQTVAEIEAAKMGKDKESNLDKEEEAAVEAIHDRKTRFKLRSLINHTDNKLLRLREIHGRTRNGQDGTRGSADAVKKDMEDYGVDATKMIERGYAIHNEKTRKRGRSLQSRLLGDDTDEELPPDGDDMTNTGVLASNTA